MNTLLASNQRAMLLAANTDSLIELLYTLLVADLESGKANPETALEINSAAKSALPVWRSALPALEPAILATLSGRDRELALADLGASLRVLIPEARKDRTLSQEDVEVYAAFSSYFRTRSQSALNKLQKLASISQNPFVVQALKPAVGNQGDTKNALGALVKSLVGREDTALSIEESQLIKETRPDDYKAYLQLRKTFTQAWRDAVVAFIRGSGKRAVPYGKILTYLQLNGISHMLPIGFTGLMDDRFRLFTEKGAQIEGIPNAVTFPSVVMNKEYGKPNGGDWIFRADRVDGSPGPYFYTTEYKKTAAKAKFEKVHALFDKMPTMRKKWFTRIKAFDPTDAKCVAAVVLELLYSFSARIGSIGNKAAGQPTYGIGTLLAKHAVVDPSGNITLRYKGKDGVPTVHKLNKADAEQKFVANALLTLLANKEPKERIFTIERNGRHLYLSPNAVNQYFRSLGAGEATVHKLRTYHATMLFMEMLEKLTKAPKTESEALQMVKKMAEVVGKKLNHVRRTATGTKVTGTTALSAYIDPSVLTGAYDNWGLRYPKFLEKKVD